MGKRLDPSLIAASSQRTMSGGLVVVRAMEIIVPLIMMLAIGAVSSSLMILDPVACVPGMKNVLKVFSTLTLVILIWGE
jgi:hypothetical protein